MAFRIDVRKTVPDTRAQVYRERFKSLGLATLKEIQVVDSYRIDARLTSGQLKKVAEAFTDLRTEASSLAGASSPLAFSWAIEIGFLPGVTDNVGSTARETIEDLLGKKFHIGEAVYASKVFFCPETCGSGMCGSSPTASTTRL